MARKKMLKKFLFPMLAALLVAMSAGAASGAEYNYTAGSYAGNALSDGTGDFDTFVGDSAGIYVTNGWRNVAVGECTGNNTDDGSYNVFVGDLAGGCLPLLGGLTNMNGAVAVGYQAGMNLSGSSDVYNTLVGSTAGHAVTTGTNNTFIGNGAGYANTTGSNNTYLGNKTGYTNVSGTHNIFIGDHAGENETGSYRLYLDSTMVGGTGTTTPLIYGEFNTNKVVVNGSLTVTGDILYPGFIGWGDTYLGEFAGESDSGTYNTFIGTYAGYSNTTGIENTFVGQRAGYYNSTGHGNVFLGNAAGYFETGSNKLYISNNAFTPLIYGEFDNKIVKINGTLVMASDARLKRNVEPLPSTLGRVMQLRGVSYEWKDLPQEGRGFGGEKEIGLIAQEVEKVFPELVHTDGEGFKSVEYDTLVPVLIEALKEQQKKIADQRDSIQEKTREIGMLEGTLEAIEKRISTLQPVRTAALTSARDVAGRTEK